MEELGHELGFDWKKRWVRCIGHVVNIVVKHMLFGQDPNAFEQQIYDGQLTAAREHEQWRKRGPVGKWHNFAVVSRFFFFLFLLHCFLTFLFSGLF